MSQSRTAQLVQLLKPDLGAVSELPDLLVGMAAEGSPRMAYELALFALEQGCPVSASHLLNIGIELREFGQLKEAMDLCDRALAIENAADLHYAKANALRQLGKLRLAVKSYASALELDPTFRDAMNNMALCYQDLNQLKKARRCLESALEFGGDADVHRNLASVYWLSHEPVASVMTEYGKSLALAPDPDVFRVVAAIMFDLDDIRSSATLGNIAHLLDDGQLSPDDPKVVSAAKSVLGYG